MKEQVLLDYLAKSGEEQAPSAPPVPPSLLPVDCLCCAVKLLPHSSLSVAKQGNNIKTDLFKNQCHFSFSQTSTSLTFIKHG